ncbi:hypothetical protein IFM89_030776, partial [Coptis chinensis]
VFVMKKTRAHRPNPQFELKQRVVIALHKLADRDTIKIGIEELEKTAHGLTQEGIGPFLSCVLDTDSGHKTSVRKECVRVMGTLVRLHQDLLTQHIGKMLSTIVKRLKDPDSVVRDACVEVVAVFSSNLSKCGDDIFLVIVKPLFEALGEQNRQVQTGSALCLASVIDNAVSPPVSVLSRMLTRITKFLKNPHFMAKPAVIELIRSIVQAGGTPTQSGLSAAVRNIEEALKNSDWTTRKAASVALAGIAMSGDTLLRSIKASCVHSLESCRFDKVKPVRDSVLQALHCWKKLPGSDSCDPSEAGSSTKENFGGGDYSDLTSASEGGWKDIASKKLATCSVKKRIPLTARKACPSLAQGTQISKANDWHIEIATRKNCTVSSAYTYNEESKSNCCSNTFGRSDANGTVVQDIEYDYVSVDEKPESSSVSNHVTSSNFETKCVTDAYDCSENSALTSPMAMNHNSESGEIVSERLISQRLRERQSMDSTVTEVSPLGRQGCCSQTLNEMSSIQKQLLDIEMKQSNLMDLLQVFMGSTMDSLSTLQSKVLGLEHSVDRISQNLVQANNHSKVVNSKLSKGIQSVSSPRRLIYTPSSSLDIYNNQPSLTANSTRVVVGEAAFSKSRSSTSGTQDSKLGRDPRLNIVRSPAVKGKQQTFGCQPENVNCQTRNAEGVTSSAFNAIDKRRSLESKHTWWKRVKDFLCTGDLDSAFLEVLSSGDDLTLIELIDRTGPVLERLSPETVGEILSTLAVHFLDQRFLGSIIPWLQQVVDLSTTYGPGYLDLTAKARKEFLSAIQAAASKDFSNPADRRSIIQLALKLRQVWG